MFQFPIKISEIIFGSPLVFLPVSYRNSATPGMGRCFPGAKNIDKFWHNLQNGIESVTWFSDEELLCTGIDPKLEVLRKKYHIDREFNMSLQMSSEMDEQMTLIDNWIVKTQLRLKSCKVLLS